ncbi:hypothetical protein KXD40_005473 [Peronospora effusa]|nr:hypothetical protein KXD40_005473 [Peronospora effusa]
MENRPYRFLVGALRYVATGTRPDIAFAWCPLSIHLEKPSKEHWNAAIRVLRYLKPGELKLSAFSVSDWRSNKDNRRSTSGVMALVNKSPVIFKSRLQNRAEYVALSLCVQEVLWAKNYFLEMKLKIFDPIIVHEDNQSAIAIAKLKDIEVVIQLKYIDTKLQLADFLTKAISTKL